MNKLFTILLVILCISSGLAQSGDDKKDGFNLPNGIRFGYQNANLVNDDLDATGKLSRGYIGYVRKITIAHFIKIETGLEYMIAGAEITNDSELQLHYIVLPAEGVFKLGPFVAEGGVSANFKIAEKYKVNGETIDRPDDDKSSAFDVALNLGLGFNIAFVTLEARHYWGLLEVEEGWYNQYWQAGLKFNF